MQVCSIVVIHANKIAFHIDNYIQISLRPEYEFARFKHQIRSPRKKQSYTSSFFFVLFFNYIAYGNFLHLLLLRLL